MQVFYKVMMLAACGLALHSTADAQITKYTQTVNAAGGTKDISGNNYEWSVGEMTLVSTFSNPNIIVTQGVLQKYDGGVGISDLSKKLEGVNVYPNPTNSLVYIQYTLPENGKLQYELTDLTGKSIIKHAMDAVKGTEKTSVNLAPYANGSYMLHLNFTASSGEVLTNTFKVDKLN